MLTRTASFLPSSCMLLRAGSLAHVTRSHVAASASSAVASSASSSSSSCVRPLQQQRSFATDTFIPKPVFSSYKLFKTKTALDISPIRAQLAWNNPVEKKWLSLKRAGGFRLTFASGENKSFDWENSELLTLSVTELGDILAFAQNKEQPDLKIFHDPQLGGVDAGKIRKELVIKRIGAGKPGYFFNFAVSEKDEAQKKWSIAVTEGEFQVILTLIQQTLPNLLALSTKPMTLSEESNKAK